ncbi:MAG: cyclase family protein [Armatimonadota bacterium]|nr:cyclase family protein [Armatimonadota bacterium]MDR7450884.1 cyclase family protein [Armatimonadota bacterium]MDR7465806.1 cyclase family protein [Armatimonadota bacterium]MDR7493714.1 cyclase family protein [Armatimonadota bacterium]MDR7498320.1 cyclase family protein [Armatimonadota bacterium]
MCVPQTFEALQSSRRDFLRLAAGTVLGAALGGVAKLRAPVTAEARSVTVNNVQDLTHVLHPRFPSFNPAFFPKFERKTFVTIKKDGFYGNVLTYWEHSGTHMDAPHHFVTGRWMVHQIPAGRLIAPAVVIHIHERAATSADAQVTPDDIRAYERRFGRIPRGALVFMHSGWEARVNDEAAYRNPDAKGTMHFPGFHPEAAELLVQERDIVGIGVDTLSLDYGASTDFKTHVTILGANKYGLENVANLARIPPRGATVFVGGPRIQDGSGGPTRVIAVW